MAVVIKVMIELLLKSGNKEIFLSKTLLNLQNKVSASELTLTSNCFVLHISSIIGCSETQ